MHFSTLKKNPLGGKKVHMLLVLILGIYVASYYYFSLFLSPTLN